jgi:hypothetical protein
VALLRAQALNKLRPDPQTPEEWQDAVDVAAAARALADCKMYGLIEGGPDIDIGRCDEILERGAARGVLPSRPAVEIAMDMVREINSGGH